MSKRVGNFLLLLLLGSLALNAALLVLTERYVKRLHATRLSPLELEYEWWQDQVISAEFPNLILLGDSRAADWYFPKTEQFNLNNRGIGAQSSSQITQRYTAHVSSLNPDIVIVQMGINDLIGIPLQRGSRNHIVEQVKHNISSIIEQAHADNAVVVLTTIFPVGSIPIHQYLFWSSEVIPAINEINLFILSLEQENILVFDASMVLMGENGRTQSHYRDDFLHLNREGYIALNNALMPTLTELLPNP